MTGPKDRNHEIDIKSAAVITQRHRERVAGQGARGTKDGELGGMFTKEAVIKLLSDPNSRYLRFYYGRNDEGGRELILVAADGDGNDMIADDAFALDTHWPCPPVCPTSPSTLRG